MARWNNSSWSDLPADILLIICLKLVEVGDYISFGLVCTTWYNALWMSRNSLPRPYPVLIVGDCDGASHGWLITKKKNSSADGRYMVELVNPFSSVNNVIQLPYLRKHEYILKGIISHNPTYTSNYAVMIIYKFCGESSAFLPQFGLAFFKPGFDSWEIINLQSMLGGRFRDIIYHKNQFYAISYGEMVSISDIITGKQQRPKVTKVVSAPTPFGQCNVKYTRLYLVESSSGEDLFCLVTKSVNYGSVITGSMRVCKFQTNGNDWVELKTIGNEAIYVGSTASLSIQASPAVVPECKPNRIYFADPLVPNTNVRWFAPGPFIANQGDVFSAQGGFPNWVQPEINLRGPNYIDNRGTRVGGGDWAIVKLNQMGKEAEDILNKWSADHSEELVNRIVEKNVSDIILFNKQAGRQVDDFLNMWSADLSKISTKVAEEAMLILKQMDMKTEDIYNEVEKITEELTLMLDRGSKVSKCSADHPEIPRVLQLDKVNAREKSQMQLKEPSSCLVWNNVIVILHFCLMILFVFVLAIYLFRFDV